MVVRVDLNISLDGFAATRTLRERVLHETGGEGTTGVDDKYAEAYFDEIWAEVMGAGMFGLHNFPDDPDWQGWWGDEPPFRVPVFVLTHAPHPAIDMANGTRFEFLSVSPEEALRLAADAAAGGDVRIGGGPTLAKEFLAAGLVDRLHVGITPILLGRGINLWEGLRGFQAGYEVSAETAESGVVHLTFQR